MRVQIFVSNFGIFVYVLHFQFGFLHFNAAIMPSNIYSMTQCSSVCRTSGVFVCSLRDITSSAIHHTDCAIEMANMCVSKECMYITHILKNPCDVLNAHTLSQCHMYVWRVLAYSNERNRQQNRNCDNRRTFSRLSLSLDYCCYFVSHL